MLSEDQLEEIREHLERAQNPLFFYDNDADGFCSYVLLRRFIDRGKGIAVRTHPDLDVGYAKRVQELGADYVFVLDRPHLGKEFVEEVKKLQVPIVWIDHHDIVKEEFDYENIFYFNPLSSREASSEPVTYWSFKIANKVEDVWIAVMGCIADHYFPEFVLDFSKRWPEYWGNKEIEKPFDAYYGTGLGLLARSIGFGLKDSITHVVYLQNFLINCKGPDEMFLELESNSSFGKKFREIRKKYDLLVRKATENAEDEIIFFSYGGDLSISSEISNELIHHNPEKYIIVAYTSGNLSNLSIRGENVKKIIENVLPNFEGASGGGHEKAVGARLKTADLDRFKEQFLAESRSINGKNQN